MTRIFQKLLITLCVLQLWSCSSEGDSDLKRDFWQATAEYKFCNNERFNIHVAVALWPQQGRRYEAYGEKMYEIRHFSKGWFVLRANDCTIVPNWIAQAFHANTIADHSLAFTTEIGSYIPDTGSSSQLRRAWSEFNHQSEMCVPIDTSPHRTWEAFANVTYNWEPSSTPKRREHVCPAGYVRTNEIYQISNYKLGDRGCETSSSGGYCYWTVSIGNGQIKASSAEIERVLGNIESVFSSRAEIREGIALLEAIIRNIRHKDFFDITADDLKHYERALNAYNRLIKSREQKLQSIEEKIQELKALVSDAKNLVESNLANDGYDIHSPDFTEIPLEFELDFRH